MKKIFVLSIILLLSIVAVSGCIDDNQKTPTEHELNSIDKNQEISTYHSTTEFANALYDEIGYDYYNTNEPIDCDVLTSHGLFNCLNSNSDESLQLSPPPTSKYGAISVMHIYKMNKKIPLEEIISMEGYERFNQTEILNQNVLYHKITYNSIGASNSYTFIFYCTDNFIIDVTKYHNNPEYIIEACNRLEN